MAPPDDLNGILDRIANGEETEGNHQLLRQLLQEKQSQSVVQLGKYTVNLGQGREIQVSDHIYQGADAETIKTVIQSVLQHPPVVRSQLTPQEYRNRQIYSIRSRTSRFRVCWKRLCIIRLSFNSV